MGQIPPEFFQIRDAIARKLELRVSDLRMDPSKGMVQAGGERVLLIRCATASFDFFQRVESFFGPERVPEAHDIARSLLFDMAHAIGVSDVRHVAKILGLTTPVELLTAGRSAMACSGFGVMNLLPESSPAPDEDFHIIYNLDHSFESETWLEHGRVTLKPVCHIHEGYASGWASASLGVSCISQEILCRAKGDPCCRFIVAPSEKLPELLTRHAHKGPPPRGRPPLIPEFFSRLKAVEALREREKQYRRVFELSPVSFMFCDLEGRIRNMNPATKALLGLSMGKHRGHDFDATLHLPTPLFPLIRKNVETYRFSAHKVTLRHGPRTLHLDLHAFPYTRSGVDFILLTFVDLTSHTEAAEERAAWQMRREDAQRLESLGVLAGGIAHDFNNLLTVIQGQAQIMERNLSQDDPSRIQLHKILTATKRSSELVRQILTFSGHDSLEFEAIDMAVLTREMADLISSSFGNGISINVEAPAGLPFIRGDTTRIRQVILNLIQNAAEASKEGGKVQVRLGQVQADSALLHDHMGGDTLAEGPYITMEIKDHGTGMSVEILRRIFEPFFSTKLKGRGFGLPAVLGIIRSHHGCLKVKSLEGQGTTVCVLLPVAPAP